MNQFVPAPLLFEYRLSVPACPGPSRRKTGRLLTLPADSCLPALSSLNGGPTFAEISAGWNPDGLAVCVVVSGKTRPPCGNRRSPEDSDCIEVWVDTRPTGKVHRATAYCHRLACLPSDESADGAPAAVPQSIPQQRETRQEINGCHVTLRRHVHKHGYELEIWIPESQLYGFRQIDELRQLGFYYLVRDTELAEQPLSVSDEFPFAWDPSLWVRLELTD